jgi:hypothetical protein
MNNWLTFASMSLTHALVFKVNKKMNEVMEKQNYTFLFMRLSLQFLHGCCLAQLMRRFEQAALFASQRQFAAWRIVM